MFEIDRRATTERAVDDARLVCLTGWRSRVLRRLPVSTWQAPSPTSDGSGPSFLPDIFLESLVGTLCDSLSYSLGVLLGRMRNCLSR